MITECHFLNYSFDGKCHNLQMSPTNFCAISQCFRDINILICYLPKVGQDHRVQFSKFDGECERRQMSHTHQAYHIRDIQIFKFWSSKSRSRSQSAIFVLHHSMAIVKIYKCLPHNFSLALTASNIYNFQVFIFKE